VLALSVPNAAKAQSPEPDDGEDRQELWALPGRSFNLLVQVPENHVIQSCRWDATGPNSKTWPSGIHFSNNKMPSTMMSVHQNVTEQTVEGYSSYGAGLPNRECGITVDNVTDADFTPWTCGTFEYNLDGSSASAKGPYVERYVNLQKAGLCFD